MAKKEEAPKIVLEREYNVPLRRVFIKGPHWKKTQKAAKGLKAFLIKHMKPASDDKGRIQLKIGKYLNEKLWKHGIRNPPHHIRIITKKDDKGLVTAELIGAPEDKKADIKKAETKTPKEEKSAKKKEEKVEAEKTSELEEKAAPKKEVKKEEKKEVKEKKE